MPQKACNMKNTENLIYRLRCKLRTYKALASLTQKNLLTYRFNFITDAIIQPVVTAIVEFLLWKAIFRFTSMEKLGEFPPESYYSYALLVSFFARVGSNWMYEFRMIEEIESGNINMILSKPLSFFEYYLIQFYSYKILVLIGSLGVPFLVITWLKYPLHWERIPLALVVTFQYLFVVYCMSYLVAMAAFKMTKVSSLTVAKNLGLWILSGELFPLDLFPSPIKDVFILLPFSCAAYIPVGYLSGRFEIDIMLRSLFINFIWILLFIAPSILIWKRLIRSYSGTGA